MTQVSQDQELANDDYGMVVRERKDGALYKTNLTPFIFRPFGALDLGRMKPIARELTLQLHF